MSDQENHKDAREQAETDQAAEAVGAAGTGASGAAPAEADAYQASPALQRAMDEAEACVTAREQSDGEAAETKTAPAGPDEELEVELETGEAVKAFDPNRVEEVKQELPPPPSKKEQEFKLQIIELRQQLRDKDKELEQKIKEMKQNVEQAKLLQRNFDGHKARVQREKADWFNYGHEPVMKELILVVDNLERALVHAGQDPATAALREGVQMTLNMFLSGLAKFGVTPIATDGQLFNPEFHQAITQVENADLPQNSIVAVHQKGYRLKDRLLRPAMVIVSKRPAVEANPQAVEEDTKKEL
jgi:molecular chaperone GrpE